MSASEASFSGTAAGGVLTVTDGVHTARLKLTGDYVGSTFIAASDGNGGVLIEDPTSGSAGPAAKAPAATANGLAAAMAGFGAAFSATPALGRPPHGPLILLLAAGCARA